MSMHVPISIFAIVAFIMIFTYTAVAIIYPEDGDIEYGTYSYGSLRTQNISFDKWIDYQFACAWNILVRNDVKCKEQGMWNLATYLYIKEDYDWSVVGFGDQGDGIFDEFQIVELGGIGCGIAWYNSDFTSGQGFLEWLFGTTPGEKIKDEYNDWMGTSTNDPQGFWDAIVQFFGALGNGFIQLSRLLTFSTIPHIPLFMHVILNIFFIPMWIILVIGIAPVVAHFISALGGVIPFT